MVRGEMYKNEDGVERGTRRSRQRQPGEWMYREVTGHFHHAEGRRREGGGRRRKWRSPGFLVIG